MPAIDLSILNQRQTPAFYADTLANRPSAGFIGRIFVSTNTFEFYRDNGTTWDLIGGPGTSTVTGTGANGQVTYWNGTSSITGSNDLFFDAVNGHFGVGTITPGTALDVKHNQSTLVQLEQETATNDTRIAFINSGVGLWRLGAFYNAGANDFGLFDIAAAAQPITVKRTTGQVLIGTSTVGSGKLVVASSTGDNGVQIVGASAPSLRIDNAESGPTKRAGFGISTATNNFIQGSADRDFCMFNGSTTASPILFGIYGTTNVQEAARISAARNLLVGGVVDNGNKLQIYGKGYINDTLILDGTGTGQYLNFYNSGVDKAHIYWDQSLNAITIGTYVAGGSIYFETDNNVDAMIINSSGNVGINQNSPNRKLYIQEAGTTTSGNVVAVRNSNATSGAYINFLAGGGNAPSIGAKGNDITFTADGYNGTELFRVSGTGPAQFSSSLSATSFGVGNNISGFGDIMLISSNSVSLYPRINRTSTSFEGGWKYSTGGVDNWYIGLRSADGVNSYHFFSYNTGTSVAQFTNSGNFLLGGTSDSGQKLQVNGTSLFSGDITMNAPGNPTLTITSSGAYTGQLIITGGGGGASKIFGNGGANFLILGANNVEKLTVKQTTINISSIPTSAAGLVSGDVYSNLGILTIVP